MLKTTGQPKVPLNLVAKRWRVCQSTGVRGRAGMSNDEAQTSPRNPLQVRECRRHPEHMFDGEQCIFGDGRSSTMGEHVRPRWLAKRWSSDDEYTAYENGQPVLDRDGNPRTTNHIPPILVPMCDGPSGCNGWLNKTYEIKGKPAVRKALEDLSALDAAETEAFSKWWVKTLLLYLHPSARSSLPDAPQISWTLPDSLYLGWRSTGALPDDLSLWISLYDPHGSGGAELPGLSRLWLNTTSSVDGRGGRGEATLHGIDLSDGRLALLLLAYHPLMNLQNPFEAAGLSTRLWPSSPNGFEVGALPVLSEEGHAQLKGLFVRAGLAGQLPAGTRLQISPQPEGRFDPTPTFVR